MRAGMIKLHECRVSNGMGRPGTKPDWQKIVKKNCNFFILFSFCPVAVPGYSRMGRDRLSKSGKISKSCPGSFRDEILSFSRYSFILGQWRDFWKVGNPILNQTKVCTLHKCYDLMQFLKHLAESFLMLLSQRDDRG